MMENFSPISALIGGGLIGTAAVILMAFHGRIAGISGILGASLIDADKEGRGWRWAFIAGLMLAPWLYSKVTGHVLLIEFAHSSWAFLMISGFIVGVGTQMGGGCTSGHGVCGMARLSARSIVATLIFMFTAMATVFITQHVMGS